MTTITAQPDPMLEARLTGLARKFREIRLHRRSTAYWSISIGFGCACFGLRYLAGIDIGWAPPVVAGLIVAATFLSWLDNRRAPIEIDSAAREIETRHPDLELALRTALEQRSDRGTLSFLQRRVVARALSHAREHDWNPPLTTLRHWRQAHSATIFAAFLVLVGLVVSDRADPGRKIAAPKLSATTLSVTPGNAELERGSIAVITARFSGAMPIDAMLIWRSAGGETRAETMAKSLSDPIFAFTLPPLQNDVTYHVQYGSRVSPTYQLSVYTLPSLVRSDATLSYPEYTRLPGRTIEETRRVSAVEGSRVTFEFTVSKPLRRAVLREENGSAIELSASNADRTRFTTSFAVQASHRWALHLEDDQGRANNPPDDIRVEAIPNRRPEPRITSPVGDPRLSPIEEVRLEGNARDDFGLLDYGVAFAIGGGEPEFVSLKNSETPPVETKFSHLLSLEARKVEPRQLITWFAWADDFGPDGKTRRSTSDLQFAEVRPLDEIFREDDSGGDAASSEANGSGEALELLELQRQISIALWNLRQQEPGAPNFAADVETLQRSQKHIRDQLQESAGELTDEAQRNAARAAQGFMEAASEKLAEALSGPSNAPLPAAWTQSQSAYQELLKMVPDETRVAQNARGRSRSSQRGNQSQLNQLEFKQAENRYETESEAQPLTSPEQREQLQALSRLRELARRQREMNERLQELQTSLAAAQDEARREETRRELRRLEDEQRRLLADTDELRTRLERMQPGNQVQEARDELDRTREDMRRAGERLERGEISPALASGTRAAESLENIREDFRRNSASQFSEQMREARRGARELTEQQAATDRKLDDLAKGPARSLDDSAAREEIARSLEEQRADRDRLLQQLREIAESSETSEPGLHRRLYDLLREHGQGGTSEQLKASAEMLRRGFVPQVQEAQAGIGRDLQNLQQGIERAAESVLGDQSAELRYAQRELEDLSKQLQREQPGQNENTPDDPRDDSARPGLASDDAGQNESSAGQQNGAQQGDAGSSEGGENQMAGGSSSAGAGNAGSASLDNESNTPNASPRTAAGLTEGLQRLLDTLSGNGGGSSGPLTGEGFGEWIERLRTVEELTDLPEARQRLAGAREQAEAMRREFKRHSREPQWGSVESGIATPLSQARVLLRQELARLENPEALQPVDRDPVPDKYAESVRKYYESLGR